LTEATYAMWATLWGMLTVQDINAWATVILVGITAYYAYQTRRLVKVEADRSEFEAKRSELESRPYLEVLFQRWALGEFGPQFEAINVGTGPAVRVRFDNPSHLLWLSGQAHIQGFTTIATGLPSARFAFRTKPMTPDGELPTTDWSTEFRIRYNDAAGLHEFADKWRLGVDQGTSYLVRVNATVLKTQPAESEDYVAPQGPHGISFQTVPDRQSS